jgi:glycosyltransferase involved in cell wall biosynthesis
MKVVLGNSHAVVDQLASEGSVLCEKLGIIYNGIPCPARTGKSGRLESRSRLHIGEDVLVISIIANLAPHKGHADLLKALAKIRAQLPAEWRLLVIGRDDGELETLVSQAGKAGINANIQFLGERDEVQKILATSDMGILCSHQEGFSNAVLEGMAAGLPMVVTDVGGNSEAVIDEETGLVVPPRDSDKLGGAILRLARDSELRKRMGEAGRKRVEENFSLDKCVDNYARLYECLLKGGKVSDVPELQVSVT